MKALKWIALLFPMLVFLTGCQSATSSEGVTPDSASETTLDPALDFTLPDSNGNMVHLADELQDNESVVLLFYLEHS